jgi:ABC-type glycerol-3-phosphate transport system substrate-binding protein
LSGRISRREAIRRATALGISAPVIAALGNAAHIASVAASEEGTLSVTFYEWILNNLPIISQVNEDFNGTFPLDAEVAPTQGFGIERFVQEARDNTSTWDMYIGVTPFLEMIQLVESGAIEPWDPYLPEGFLDSLPQSIRDEGSYDGSFYVWPFLLDVTIQTWNAEMVERAGLDPEAAPATWDEFISNARAVVDSGAAPFGLLFDFHAWRSLIPITHSISTDVYDDNGLFVWNSEPAVQALEIMKEMMELTVPDVLNEGTSDAGVNLTPDEQAFAAQRAAYYIKYQNAPMRFAGTWPDPSQLRLGPLPAPEGGAGGTVFWDTGAALFTHGLNKEAAADYMMALSTDMRIWEQSITGNPDEGVVAVGQLPVTQMVWDELEASPPEWLTANPWATELWTSLPDASAIVPTPLSLTQFTVAAPFYSAYLAGDVDSAQQAMDDAQAAVEEEFQKASS